MTEKNKDKYLIFIFSDKEGKPSENFKPYGIFGLRHFEAGFLSRLPLLGNYLNRKIVFPPPWITLGHNRRKTEKNNTWNDYFNLEKIKNFEKNPPFSYKDNCDIKTDLSIKYYRSDTNIKKIDNNSDIIALFNFNDPNSKLVLHSFLPLIKIKRVPSIKYKTNKELRNYSKIILDKLKLDNFIFMHLRRGDMLDNKELFKNGTRFITNPKYIYHFLKYIEKKLNTKKILIATNEKKQNYKKELSDTLSDYDIKFENDYFDYLPENIINDNTFIYLISHEIAKKSKINITTTHWLRLGSKIDYKLSERQIYFHIKDKYF